MDERKITDMISSLFSNCENEEEAYELESLLSDIVKQERENRLYELELGGRKEK